MGLESKLAGLNASVDAGHTDQQDTVEYKEIPNPAKF